MEAGLTETDIECRSLTKIMQFRLNRETEDLREDFFKSVVTTGLMNGISKLMTIQEVGETICEKYSVCRFPHSIIEHYLKEMLTTKDVEQKGGKYSLSKQGRMKYLRQNGDREHIEKSIFSKLLRLVEEKCGRKLAEPENHDVKRSFREFLARYLTARGRDVARIFVREPGPRIEASDFLGILNDAMENLKDKKVQESLIEAIRDLMTTPDTEFANFLSTALQKYVYFEVMDLDPRCRALEKETLARKKIFIDTNIIFDLIFESEERHALIKDMVKLTTNLNIKIMFTERTKTEFLNVLAKTANRHREWARRVTEKTMGKLLAFESGVIRSFYKEKEDKPALTFDMYMGSLEKGFERILKEKYGIELDSASSAIMVDSDYLATLCDVVGSCARKNVQFKDSVVVEHDAYHLALVSKLRENDGNGFLGPETWFVTSDDSLYCVSKELMARKRESYPLSVRSDVWLQASTIFLPTSALKQDSTEIWVSFMKFCCSAYARSLPEIDRDKLLRVAGPWMDVEWLTAEDIADIASHMFVGEYLHNPQETESPTPEVISPIVSKKVTDKMTQLEDQLEKARKEKETMIMERTELLKEVKAARGKTRLVLFLPGLLCIVSILCLAFLGYYYGKPIPDIVYWCLTIMAIVFIASSVFGSKIFKTISVQLPR